MDRFGADGLELPKISRSLYDPRSPISGMLDVRMLFSALVDADFLETEAHFDGESEGIRRYRQAGPELEAGRALGTLIEHLDKLSKSSTADPAVRKLRSDLLQACLQAAEQPRGLFTLTAPTGAGKTLAMLAFGLRHAERHGLRRIIVAIPFLSIIEQSAAVYRQVFERSFDENYVLEHHSLADVTEPLAKAGADVDHEAEHRRLSRQLAENWDAPIVLTTNVQLLESLFSNRPGRCRKLHRMAQSILLFDEVQTLPPHLAVPTLGALSHLANRYGATVLFSTATQPAFQHLDVRVRQVASSGWEPREIASVRAQLSKRARRTVLQWNLEERWSWDAIARRVLTREQTLCIVNLKRHAVELARTLVGLDAEGIFHLSTNLCAVHRSKVLQNVRARLDAGQTCRLISTQCVEAGVDVDFPVVFRAFGPLEAIAQAAGRCNRNGRLEAPGEVIVFQPDVPADKAYPPGAYKQASDVTRLVIGEEGGALDIEAPEVFRRYYQRLYDLTRLAEIAPEFRKSFQHRSFVEVAKLYQLVPDQTINVLVPYDVEAFHRLREELNESGRLTRRWTRRAQPHSVSLFRPRMDADVWSYLDPVPLGRGQTSDDWFLYLKEDHYDRHLLGLTEAREAWIA
jgi:CRISPR-associated helicase Cas3